MQPQNVAIGVMVSDRGTLAVQKIIYPTFTNQQAITAINDNSHSVRFTNGLYWNGDKDICSDIKDVQMKTTWT